MGFIYVGSGNDDLGYKIGSTGRPELERLKQHRTANPSFEFSFRFESLYYSQLETELQHHFASRRIRTTKEWFLLNDLDLGSLEDLVHNLEALIGLRFQLDSLKGQESSSTLLEPDSCDKSAYLRLRVRYEERFHLNQIIERDESMLRLRIGPNNGIDGYVTWKSQVQPVFDRDLFEQDHPGLYDKYRRPTIRRCFRLL